MSAGSEKQRRRAEREQAEQERAARERHTARLRIGGLTAVGALAVVAAVAAFTQSSSSTPSASGAPVSAFDAHYADLPARLQAVGLPTMSSPQSDTHSHQSLAVYVDGRRVPVPENVGVDPSADPGDMAGLHTHSPGFTIHNEGVANPTLGEFFAVWGVPFSAIRLGPDTAQGDRKVRMWVDGKPSQQFERLALADGERIAVTYGSDPAAPPMPPAPVA